MEALFQSGNIAFVVLAVMLIELWILRHHVKRVPVIIFGLGAGAFLVLALRSALLQDHWVIIAAFLAASFVFHLLEIQSCLRLSRRVP